LQVSDNLPIISEGRYGARRKAICEFCKEKHEGLIEHCELEVMGIDTRNPQHANKVLLQNVID